MFDEAALAFLESHNIGVLATVGNDGWPQACTIFYVVDFDYSLIFKSRSASDHMQSLLLDNRAALAIYRHDSTYRTKAGLQLKGTVIRIQDVDEMRDAVEHYSTRFDGARDKFSTINELLSPASESTLYRFIPRAYKLTDGWRPRTDANYTPIRENP